MRQSHCRNGIICTEETSEQTRVVNSKVRKEKLKQVVDGGLINFLTKETFTFIDWFNIETDSLRQHTITWFQNSGFQEGLKYSSS